MRACPCLGARGWFTVQRRAARASRAVEARTCPLVVIGLMIASSSDTRETTIRLPGAHADLGPPDARAGQRPPFSDCMARSCKLAELIVFSPHNSSYRMHVYALNLIKHARGAVGRLHMLATWV